MQHKTIQCEDAVQKDKLIIMLDEFNRLNQAICSTFCIFFPLRFCELNYHVVFPFGLFRNYKAVE